MSQSSPWPQYAKTIPSFFYERTGKWADKVVFRYKEGGDWTDVTWGDAEDNILAIASGLIEEGFKKGCAISILSANRPEWAYADLGTMSAGILNVPIYPTNTAEQVAYILEDSGAEAVFVENKLQLDKVLQVKKQLTKLRKIIVIEPYTQTDDLVTDLPALMALGREKMDRQAIEKRWQSVDPEELATLIYTSGTTGNPKGVMLSHRNLASNIVGISHFLSIQPGEKDLQFLPMCHSFGRMEVLGMMMYQATICFAEAVDKIPANFKEIRPDIFVTVPRLLEKVYAKVMAGVNEGPAVKKALFNWAMNVGKQRTQLVMNKQPVPTSLNLQFQIADRLVFSKIKAALGGKLRVLVYAAAPLVLDIQEFFAATGITALEAYGLTETSPGLTGNKPDDFRLGTVGKTWSDTEIRIADDGEILARGPQVMRGYYHQPEATAEALEGGWFHTGDIGEIDDGGFLKITDRKKDLIITAGGKNISPQNIENMMKINEAIEQVAVIGDRRKYLSALVVPNFEWLQKFAKEKGLTGDLVQLLKTPEVIAEYDRRIGEMNKNLAKYETIKKYTLLDQEFTIENNMLTPTLKVKRKEVNSSYKQFIDSMYPND